MASRPLLRPPSKAALIGAIALTASVGGCLVGASGIVPPTTKLYFPTAMVVSPGRSTLYVANSDFHKPKHLYSWKTLIRAEKTWEGVKRALRGNLDVALMLFRPVRLPDPPAID